MSEARNRRRMVGSYYQDPEAMLTHAIAVTLTVATAMVGAPTTRRVLSTICCSESMLRRAAKRIYHHVLRQMAPGYEPTSEDLNQLVREVVAIAKES